MCEAAKIRRVAADTRRSEARKRRAVAEDSPSRRYADICHRPKLKSAEAFQAMSTSASYFVGDKQWVHELANI